MTEGTGKARVTLRWVTGFMAVVWAVNFGACASTKGLVPGTVANIQEATNELGDFSWIGLIFSYGANIVLGLAGLTFYAALWVSWLRHFPPRASEPSAAGAAVAVQLAGSAQIRVCMHYALVLFATGNYPPFGPLGLVAQGLALASVVVGCVVLIRAGRLAGPPYVDLWLAAALLVAAALGVEAWVCVQASAVPS